MFWEARLELGRGFWPTDDARGISAAGRSDQRRALAPTFRE